MICHVRAWWIQHPARPEKRGDPISLGEGGWVWGQSEATSEADSFGCQPDFCSPFLPPKQKLNFVLISSPQSSDVLLGKLAPSASSSENRLLSHFSTWHFLMAVIGPEKNTWPKKPSRTEAKVLSTHGEQLYSLVWIWRHSSVIVAAIFWPQRETNFRRSCCWGQNSRWTERSWVLENIIDKIADNSILCEVHYYLKPVWIGITYSKNNSIKALSHVWVLISHTFLGGW